MLLALFLSAFTTASFAFDCGPSSWQAPPALREGKFMGTLQASCTLIKRGGDPRKLDEHFTTKLARETVTRHAGPVADNTLGLPGVLFDLTVRHESGSMRNLVKLATDGRDVFLYDARSKEIRLSGMDGYLRKLDNVFRLERTGAEDFRFTLTTTTHVAKPALAPGPVFLGIAKDKARDQFVLELRKLAEEIENAL
jgi:hypothetical protein